MVNSGQFLSLFCMSGSGPIVIVVRAHVYYAIGPGLEPLSIPFWKPAICPPRSKSASGTRPEIKCGGGGGRRTEHPT